jgi:hypothetical protein
VASPYYRRDIMSYNNIPAGDVTLIKDVFAAFDVVDIQRGSQYTNGDIDYIVHFSDGHSRCTSVYQCREIVEKRAKAAIPHVHILFVSSTNADGEYEEDVVGVYADEEKCAEAEGECTYAIDNNDLELLKKHYKCANEYILDQIMFVSTGSFEVK